MAKNQNERKGRPWVKGLSKSLKPLTHGGGGGSMPSISEIKENTPITMKPIDGGNIETNTPTSSVQNISVGDGMKTGFDFSNTPVQSNMSKEEVKEEKQYLRKSKKGNWEKYEAKDEKKSYSHVINEEINLI